MALSQEKQMRSDLNKELDKEVPKLEKRIATCTEEMKDEELYSENTTIEKGIEIVDTLEKEVMDIKKKGEVVNDQQKFLEVNEVYFESIDELVSDFSIVKKLWYGLDKMRKYYKEWLGIPLKDIVVEEIEEKLSEVVKASQQCILALETSGAAQKFKNEVDLMKNTAPIVS